MTNRVCCLPDRSLRLAVMIVVSLACGRACGGDRPGSVVPGRTWDVLDSAAAGCDAAALQAFAEYVGGRGCVVRQGRLVHTWGDYRRAGDVASAAKPVYVHFLLKAVEDGKLRSVDDHVSVVEPRLGDLNAGLDFKDRRITWRHLACQTSCYGVRERPGTAYDYSDYNMALLFDTLFLKVYESDWSSVDRDVLHPHLADRIGCEDRPTFLAFGTQDRPGRLAISPRDFCRFGLLYLHKGRWDGEQLLDERLVEMAVASPIPNEIPRTSGQPAGMLPDQRSIGGSNNQTDHLGSYSFAWWTNGVDREGRRHWPDAPHDTFGAFGHGGKRALVVIPGLEFVVSWNDSRIQGRDMENEALRRLIRSVADAADEDTGR